MARLWVGCRIRAVTGFSSNTRVCVLDLRSSIFYFMSIAGLDSLTVSMAALPCQTSKLTSKLLSIVLCQMRPTVSSSEVEVGFCKQSRAHHMASRRPCLLSHHGAASAVKVVCVVHNLQCPFECVSLHFQDSSFHCMPIFTGVNTYCGGLKPSWLRWKRS